MATKRQKKRGRLTFRDGLLTLPNGMEIFVSEFEPLLIDERFCIRVTDQRQDPARQILLRTTNAVAFYRLYDPARGKQIEAAVNRAKWLTLMRRMEARKHESPGLDPAPSSL